MRYIIIITLFLSLVSCAKEIPFERSMKLENAPNKVNSENSFASNETIFSESSEFSYIGLTLDQAQTAARQRNEKFRVVKRDGVDLPVTLDFVYGRINAEILDGLVVSFSVEGAA